MTPAITRFVLPVAALALLGLEATALGAPPYRPAPAQKQAEYACVAQDIRQGSPLWELCLSHVTRAYEWDEPALALQLAHAAGGARETCLERGLAPDSADYRACAAHEIEAQSMLMVLGNDDGGTDVAQAQQ